ncbi:hypothetical protein [Streptomyces sp. MAR4 CNX-425]|uniref:hypothetical protein n=1 Tax=Streptomyces sp. MAR4 CNX-425 TaxID=3406343 RepID=UPI003B50A66D
MHDTSAAGARVVEGRGAVLLLRTVSVLACLETLVQGLLAGMLLNGDVDSVDPHGLNAYFFELLVFLQVVSGVLLWRRNRGLTWPLWGATGLLAATFAQVGLGLEGSLAAHVTLGVALCAMETAFVLRVFTSLTAPPAAPAASQPAAPQTPPAAG